MAHDTRVKICGLTETADIPAAIVAGAAYVGFVFFPKSPRHLDLEAAQFMATSVPEGIVKVALTVDADDAMLDELTAEVPLDMLQLHGERNRPDADRFLRQGGRSIADRRQATERGRPPRRQCRGL
jgi:phosphoribosylanthranilate isomerase